MPYSKTIYWDSCIWIAWLWNELRDNHEMDGIFECAGYINRSEYLLIVSSIFNTEVAQTGLSEDAQRALETFLTRRNVQMMEIDVRVGALSIDIKKYYRDLHKKDGKGELTDNDATHLATAIHYRVDAFYTFDDGGKGDRSLLSLNGDVAGNPLVVCKPPVTQLRLFT